jgi:hypothetical protein
VDKKKLAQAAILFNTDGQKAWKAIQGLKVLTEPLTPESVVQFMRSTPNLGTTFLGSLLLISPQSMMTINEIMNRQKEDW